MSTAAFWKGDFGEEYLARNQVEWEARVPFWRRILEGTRAKSFIEVGVSAAWNFRAIRSLDQEATMSGLDVNISAVDQARAAGFEVDLAEGKDLGTLFLPGSCDMALTSGVLIHIAPEELKPTMQALVDVSKQYVLAIEYQAGAEEEIDYRGHAGKLWRRPFGKLYEELGLSLLETGVAQGFDQCHYWLMEK